MKFTPTSEAARQEVLEYAKTQMTIDDAKKFLEEQGYYADNLWHIDDVTSSWECSDTHAYKVLEMALTNAWTMEQISESIYLIAQYLDLEKK
jgi:nitrate/TMAO reductase-like tetraheme cytochrome c subunit